MSCLLPYRELIVELLGPTFVIVFRNVYGELIVELLGPTFVIVLPTGKSITPVD
jgi:hypothetical protein